MQYDAGIEFAAAGTRTHRQSVKGGKSHRRRDRNTCWQRAGRAAIAEMRDDDAAFGNLRRTLWQDRGDVFV